VPTRLFVKFAQQVPKEKVHEYDFMPFLAHEYGVYVRERLFYTYLGPQFEFVPKCWYCGQLKDGLEFLIMEDISVYEKSMT
jgi:hypothetical protein